MRSIGFIANIAGGVGFSVAAALAGCITISSSSIGTFAGILPCADCAGILTELRLYAERPSGRPTHYELTETYLGARDGDRSIGTAGPWTNLRGSADDRDATVVQIDLGRVDARKNFLRVGNDELRLLDRNRKEILSAASHSLHLVSELPAATLVESDSERMIEVESGQRVFVVLGSNRTTGYDWALETSGSLLTRLGDPAYVRGAAPLGEGGTTIWPFVARGTGKQELRFRFRRPSGPVSAVAKTLTYTIMVR